MEAASVNVLPIWRWEEATGLATSRRPPLALRPSLCTHAIQRVSLSLSFFLPFRPGANMLAACDSLVVCAVDWFRRHYSKTLFLYCLFERKTSRRHVILWSVSIADGIEITSNKNQLKTKKYFLFKDNCAGHHEFVRLTLDPPPVLRLLSR